MLGLCVLLLACLSGVQGSLPELNIDLSNTTVSGLGAGAYFAGQFHVAYSSFVRGAALFGGGPWYCAEGQLLNTQTECSVFPDFIDVPSLEKKAKEFEQDGHIDPLSNLADDNVYIFHGSFDSTYHKKCSTDSKKWYENYGTNVSTSLNAIPCGHGQPTDHAGVDCKKTHSPFINNCQWDGYYHALEFVIPGLNKPTTASPFNLFTFNQNPYFSADSCLAPTGYVYIPNACQQMQLCQVHIAFHDCNQDLESVGTDYVKSTGLNAVAESNNIVVLYPQVEHSLADPINPNACWDWWGYSESQLDPIAASRKYVYKSGKQISAVHLMLMNLSGNELQINTL